MRIAEFRKGIFCGIKIAENVLVELCQLNRCTSAERSTTMPSSLVNCALQEEIVDYFFIIALVGLR